MIFLKMLVCAILLGWELEIFSENKTIYIVPIGGDKGYFGDPHYSRDEVARPFYELKKSLEDRGYSVKFTMDGANLTDFAGLIAFNDVNQNLLHNILSYDKSKCLLFLFEPPVVMPSLHNQSFAQWFGKVFVMFDGYVNTLYKFYYPQPRKCMIDGIPTFARKKFCVMINGNKDFYSSNALYAERRKVIQFFQAKLSEDFDLYGPDWHGYASWRGSVKSKWETLKNYKFCICYENMGNQLGFITEKIFDCLVAGCVPVYLGASNITDYVPAACFIDRRNFTSDEELYAFLKNISEKRYKQYLDNITQYFKSPQAHLFSIDNFINTIAQGLGL